MSSRYTPAALAAPRGLAALASLASLASLSLACVGRSPDRAAAGDASADATAADTAAGDGALDATTRADGTILLDRDAAPAGSFCSLPGSVVWGDQGPAIVPGADASSPDLSWLHVPAGFCAHYFATVKTARQLRFAPGGELFVSSPTTGTTGAANDGISGIVVLPDDDRDGFADSNITFLSGLPSVQGLMFNAGYFYFQDGTFVRRV
ncbi:MAG TPA: hypothetical protein VE987_22820, partial [Polyangiaceae bacterium]|nr:hypothetical protein [Polyangiaceae bacterium]